MVFWFQRILLSFVFYCCLAPVSTSFGSELQADNERFELGVSTGVLNIGDFASEFTFGVNANFIATEDFFLQINYVYANSSLSSYELNNGALFSGDDRNFHHFDFLVGYNLFQGEVFFTEGKPNLSNLYLVFGVGDTNFGGEAGLTFTLGTGYQMNLSRQVILRFDVRDYFYRSNLVRADEATHNLHLMTSLSYLF